MADMPETLMEAMLRDEQAVIPRGPKRLAALQPLLELRKSLIGNEITLPIEEFVRLLAAVDEDVYRKLLGE